MCCRMTKTAIGIPDMRIETTRFGALEVEEKAFICFPWGIPGFERLKRYVLLEHRQGPFHWLQAVDDAGVAFVVCPAESVGIRYEVPEVIRKSIDLECQEDLSTLVMVSFDRSRAATRFHVKGPLLFNAALRRACQWTIDQNDLSRYVRHTQENAAGTG